MTDLAWFSTIVEKIVENRGFAEASRRETLLDRHS